MSFSRNFYDFQVVELKGNNPTAYYAGVTLTANVNFLTDNFTTSGDHNVLYRLFITTPAASGTITITGMSFNDTLVTEVIILDGTSTYETLNYFIYVSKITPSVILTTVDIGRGSASSIPYLANFNKSAHYITINGAGAAKWTVYGRITNKDFSVPYSQEYILGASFDDQSASTTYPLIYDEPVGMLRMITNPDPGQTVVWNMGTQQIK